MVLKYVFTVNIHEGPNKEGIKSSFYNSDILYLKTWIYNIIVVLQKISNEKYEKFIWIWKARK